MSENIDTGGSAFPSGRAKCDVTGDDYAPEPGMTLRDYFAAHAPTIPQYWFEPVFEEKEPVVVSYPQYQKDNGDDYGPFKNEGTAVKPKPRNIYWEWRNLKKVHDAWREARSHALSKQWPYAWADEQIRQRNV